MSEEKSCYCDDCVLVDVCGKEGYFDEAVTFCSDKYEFIPKSVVKDIKAEIASLIEWHDCPIELDNGNDAWYCEACNKALQIIDKHIKGVNNAQEL